MKTPVAIIAYNRPQYLERILQPLPVDRPVYMFIDGPRNEHDVSKINESIDIFKNKFSKGCKIFAQKTNVGVARNQRVAKETIFNEYSRGLFIEEDILVADYYCEMLDLLLDMFEDDDRVGAINGFPGHTLRKKGIQSLQDQQLNKNKFVTMDHILGYGLYKRSYVKTKPYMEGYLKILPKEYRDRSMVQGQIYNYWASHGVKIWNNSQDAAFQASLYCANQLRFSTGSNHLTHIGANGEHSNPATHAQGGWDSFELLNELVTEFEWDDQIYNELMKEESNKFKTGCP